eukprot:TRINITY_DN5773_c0_g1_i1.p1 TRINITY_DN5773_c0_g1~~TRINITY_DN5773_c0_g1_i1.p1  ORF type:complete len:323 (-),score=82.62 TRINITY_DN5773_c0_g1_i1:28-996(-)
MFTGQPGKKYGLILTGKKRKATIKKAKPITSSLFSSDGSGAVATTTEDVREQLRVAQERKKRKRDNIERNEILGQDPTAFEYDEVFEEMKGTSERAGGAKKEVSSEDKARQPKYIHKLLEESERRKREQQTRTDRIQRKEIEKEKEEYGERERFITSGYRKKLIEDEKWEEEEKKKEKRDGDVRNKGSIASFYSNLLNNRNVSMGGAATPTRANPPPPSSPPQATETSTTTLSPSKSTPPAAAATASTSVSTSPTSTSADPSQPSEAFFSSSAAEEPSSLPVVQTKAPQKPTIAVVPRKDASALDDARERALARRKARQAKR